MKDKADLKMVGDKDELLLEMESMLRDQIELHPLELRPRIRLAKVHAELRRPEAFLEDAKALLLLTQNEPGHPAHLHLAELARELNVELPSIDNKGEVSGGGPRRRLGEDPKAKAYFERLNERFTPLTKTPAFISEHDRTLIRFFNRPSPLMHLSRLSRQLGGAQIALKREDMLGQGTRMIMTVAGQVLLAAKLGYSCVVTGSSNLRTAVHMASVAARHGLTAVAYTDDHTARRNSALILQIRCFGGKVVMSRRSDSVRDEAMAYCLQDEAKRFMVMGVEAAPPPFPQLNQALVGTLGREVRAQANAMFKRPPDMLVSRGHNTADAIGLFEPFLKQEGVRMVCVEALDTLETPGTKTVDVFDVRHGQQLSEDQILQAEAILEGSEFPSVRREHSRYKASKRVEYTSGSLSDARRVIKEAATYEGLILPVRTSFPLGWATRQAKGMKPDELIVVNMIEPFDKDLRDVAASLGVTDI